MISLTESPVRQTIVIASDHTTKKYEEVLPLYITTIQVVTVEGLSVSGSSAGNYLANTSAATTTSITQREVSVAPAETFFYVNEGDPLPQFSFHFSGWITGDTGNEGYTVVRDSDGASYDPASDESAGTYTITPTPLNTNYAFVIETGTLYVNPYGPGTRAVKPL